MSPAPPPTSPLPPPAPAPAPAPRRFEGKVAIVTGAGLGIGRATALRLAAEGAFVVAATRKADEATAVAQEIQAAGGQAVACAADVARKEDVLRMVETAMHERGRLDVLVNNAGILDDFMPAADTSDELWSRVMAVNLDGVFYACRAALPIMVRQADGAILNIASIGGLQGSRAGAAYTASKHAVVGLTRNIGYMYARTGVRCNAIAPGGVATHIADGMHPHPFGYERASSGFGTAVRMAQPDEVAAVAAFLASPEASFINGTVVTADAGWTAY